MLLWSPLATMRSRCGGCSATSSSPAVRTNRLGQLVIPSSGRIGENRCLCLHRLQTHSREAVLVDRSGRREIVTATAAAIILGILVSWGAVYGLNRYLGPGADPHETPGALRAPHPSD